MTRANKKKIIVSFLFSLALFFSAIGLGFSLTNDSVTVSAYNENIQLTQPCDYTQEITSYKRASTGTRSFSCDTWIECTSSGNVLLEVYRSVPMSFSYSCYLVDSNSSTTGTSLGSFDSSAVKKYVDTVAGKYLYFHLSSETTTKYVSSDLHIVLPAAVSSTTLSSPVLSYDSSQKLLSWTATNEGGDYQLYNETTGSIAAETMYTSFRVTQSGVYKVKALGDGDSTEDSPWSNTVTVDLSSDPIPLTAPVLSYSSSINLLSWTYPEGTDHVDHVVVAIPNGSTTQYQTSVSGFSPSVNGFYRIYLVAKSGSGYSDSDYSNTVSVTLSSAPDPTPPTTLSAPVLSYDSSQNLLSWTATNEGGDYQLYNETTGSIATETMLTDFYPSVSGVYKVKALGDGDSTEDSVWSNTVSVSVPVSTLSSPTLSLSGKVLSWTSSGDRITYEVNNVTTGDTYTTQSLSFTVSVLGLYRVRALGDPGSGWSNTVFVDISSASDRYGLGYNDGYAAGFADGMLKASEGGGLRDLFLSIGDVPLHVIDGLLGGAALEDVFGFNLKTTFLTILVVLIIALLVRKFVGL